MKFLHTADWQVGMKAAHAGKAGTEVRRARLTAARRVVETARAERVEFVIVAGDTFEDNAVRAEDVQQVGEILGALSCPVFILPGNHDPDTAGSVWEHPVWSGPDNLKLLRTREPVPVTGGVLYPCPLRQRWSGENPTAWIPARTADGIRIGIAHGTLDTLPDAASNHPIPPDAASRMDLDYLALGHWHSTRVYRTNDGAERMAYCGTHEQTKFGEDDSGNVLVVEVDAPGAAPRVEKAKTGTLEWLTIEREIESEGQLKLALRELEALTSARNRLVDVTLRGFLYDSERGVLDSITTLLDKEFIYGRLDDTELAPPAMSADLPAGYLREVERRLLAMAGDEESGVVARRALQGLYRTVRGGGK